MGGRGGVRVGVDLKTISLPNHPNAGINKNNPLSRETDFKSHRYSMHPKAAAHGLQPIRLAALGCFLLPRKLFNFQRFHGKPISWQQVKVLTSKQNATKNRFHPPSPFQLAERLDQLPYGPLGSWPGVPTRAFLLLEMTAGPRLMTKGHLKSCC